MSIAKRCGRWQGGGAADSTNVRQGDSNAASGILLEFLKLQHPHPANKLHAMCSAIWSYPVIGCLLHLLILKIWFLTNIKNLCAISGMRWNSCVWIATKSHLKNKNPLLPKKFIARLFLMSNKNLKESHASLSITAYSPKITAWHI